MIRGDRQISLGRESRTSADPTIKALSPFATLLETRIQDLSSKKQLLFLSLRRGHGYRLQLEADNPRYGPSAYAREAQVSA